MKFSEWKAVTMAKLIQLKEKYAGNQKALNDINAIMNKLVYARARDLSTVLLYIHASSVDIPEIIKLVPSPEEISEWFKREE